MGGHCIGGSRGVKKGEKCLDGGEQNSLEEWGGKLITFVLVVFPYW